MCDRCTERTMQHFTVIRCHCHHHNQDHQHCTDASTNHHCSTTLQASFIIFTYIYNIYIIIYMSLYRNMWCIMLTINGNDNTTKPQSFKMLTCQPFDSVFCVFHQGASSSSCARSLKRFMASPWPLGATRPTAVTAAWRTPWAKRNAPFDGSVWGKGAFGGNLLPWGTPNKCQHFFLLPGKSWKNVA